uniref:DUF1822 domain-containing protein n=1 Tax=Cyanothece sp. (strain PCC 7425 / ATCC 29141) TaxID=395961 RepID=B8HYS9_CYAP4
MSAESLMYPATDHLWFDLSSEELKLAQQQSQRCSNPAARWRAYLNALALGPVLSWLKSEWGDDLNVEPWLPADQHPQIWEFVNGMAIAVGNRRWVLLPQETDDLQELVIPQEWVDIREWAGHYYVGIQVNPDQQWLQLWAYVTYEDIKERGDLDPLDQTYTLEQEDLTEDIALLMISQEQALSTLSFIPAANSLNPTQTQALIQKLSDPEVLNPRLCLPFSQWSALISHPERRQQLYQQRQPVRLGEWLGQQWQGIKESGWQKWENLSSALGSLGQLGVVPIVGANLGTAFSPAIAMRSLSPEFSASNPIEQYGVDSPQVRLLIQEWAKLSPQSPEAVKAIPELEQILQTAQEEDTRWLAAETLWLLSPGNQAAGFWGMKQVDLGIDLAGQAIGLVLAVLPKSSEQVSVFVRVYPLQPQASLPAKLELQILDQTGEVFQQLSAREQDRVLQYKFWGSPGEEFGISLKLNQGHYRENFIL